LLKIILSYLLLASFAVLHTPRDFWHECGHDHDHDHAEEVVHASNVVDLSGAPLEMEDDCFACDFDLGFFTHKQPDFLALIERIHCENAVRILSRLNEDKTYSFSLRGPPVTI
jgi:hypothetical protein